MRHGILTLLTLSLLAGCNQPGQEPVASAPKNNGVVETQTSVPLTIIPNTVTIGIGQKLNFSSAGGVPPYVFTASAGSITSIGTYSAPYTAGSITVTLKDSRGTQVTAAVTVNVGTSLTPNDPRFSDLYALHQDTGIDIKAPEAWAIQTDCRGVRIGVLDTGIDARHPDLGGNIWTNPAEAANNGHDEDANGYVDDLHGWNFVNNTKDATDDNLHGTHVAGTIGAIGNNGIGVTGVCWRASLVPLKFLDYEGAGYTSDAVDAVDYATHLGVKVINASFGGGGHSQSMKDAIDRAHAAGIIFIAAAGNAGTDNDTTPFYPANYSSPNIISVAATTRNDVLPSYSNWGATSVHIAAPGDVILSTFPLTESTEMTALNKTTSYESLNGTSMAAPHVAGAAALLWTFDPSLTALGVRNRILDRADVVTALNNKVAGSKRLNLRKMLYAQ